MCHLPSYFGSYLFYYVIVACLHCGKINEFAIRHIVSQYLIFIFPSKNTSKKEKKFVVILNGFHFGLNIRWQDDKILYIYSHISLIFH
jgi:uncharacterized lipoprotein YehR (DUF1307 family)